MKFSIRSVAAAAGLALTMGSAFAVPTFTIDDSAILGGPSIQTTGDKFAGSSSELLTISGNTTTGSGWLNISALDYLGVAAKGFGNLGTYGLYVTYTLADTYINGGTGPGTVGSNSVLTLLDFKVWADPTKNNTYTQAAASTATAATVGNVADDILLGFGSLINGVDGFDANGGAFLNSTETFNICSGAGTALFGALTVPGAGCTSAAGTSFFVSPVPFYTLAFDEFNNTQQGVAQAGNLVSINQASGGVDFNNIPEPGSIALLGLALAGLGMTSRRSKKSTSV